MVVLLNKQLIRTKYEQRIKEMKSPDCELTHMDQRVVDYLVIQHLLITATLKEKGHIIPEYIQILHPLIPDDDIMCALSFAEYLADPCQPAVMELIK